VLLKLLPVGTVTPGALRQLVGAACRARRAAAAIHVGTVAGAAPRGLPLPVRFRPSPLNMIFRWIGDDADRPAPTMGAYEFLDFDAY
jgi:hypothetical protein